MTRLVLGTIDQDFAIDSDNSPYPEVRANVPNTDNVELPVNTVRMWFLGIVFTMVSQRRSVTLSLVANWYVAWIRNKSVFLHAIPKCRDYFTRGKVAKLSSWISPCAFAALEGLLAAGASRSIRTHILTLRNIQLSK